MQNIRKMSALLGAGAVILALAGCADKDNSGQAESPAAPGQVGNAVSDNLGDTANAVAGGVGAVGNAVTGGGQAVANGAANAGKAVAGAGNNAAMTSSVKTALLGEKALNGAVSGINVNSDSASKTVTLNGTVKSAAQKSLAGAIAKKNATGMTIKNNLKVGK